jgi:hypothetical protein
VKPTEEAACTYCARALGPDDGPKLHTGCRAAVEEVLRAADPKLAATLRRHYGIEEGER